ncbi:MAG: dihydroorotase [Lachnospiraceae bacterium]
MKLLIKNGRVIDPDQQIDSIRDLLIEDGVIKDISPNIDSKDVIGIDATVVDAKGYFVMPGFIDLHVHLRDPGFTEKEDIESGSRAAVRGGFTTIVAMPNTSPSADCAQIITYVQHRADEIGLVHVLQAGAITKGQGGQALSDMKKMFDAGCRAYSEDGKSVMDAELYRQGMEIAAKLGAPVFAHCEDKSLVAGGVMNKGKRADELGMKGIGNYTEDVIAARDTILAGATGCQLHLCHCSTKGSVDIIRYGKSVGVKVSGEVCPHHFILTDEDILCDDANYKMNPPLRSKEDVEELIKGLSDGTLEVISTDHAPHTGKEKSQSMASAPFGIIGLETAASLTYTALVKEGYLTPMQMAEKMSRNPAAILNIEKGSLAVGKAADVTIFDPEAFYKISEADFAGKSKNSPFVGKEVFGKVVMTINDGNIVYQESI